MPLLDWQPVNLVPDDEIDFRCAQCKGRFEDPLKDVEIELDVDESNLEVSADQTDVTEQELVFTGNVLVKQGLRTMRADAVTADREQQTATATGNVLFREPDAALIGETIYYDSEAEHAKVTNAQFVLHSRNMSGAAAQLTRKADGHIDIQDGRMSYCAPDDQAGFCTNTLEIDPESGDGQAWGAKLAVSGSAGTLSPVDPIPC